jgi:opacity protein-like surface antigen
MERKWILEILAFGAVLAMSAPAPAWAWDPVSPAPAEDFTAFHRRFSSDLYPYPRHGAAPLGLIGFEVYTEGTYDKSFDRQPFFRTVIDGNLTGGVLSVGRVGVRKGLPGGIDFGVSYGEALGSNIHLLSAEVEVALLHGGLAEPAVGLRFTGTRTVNTPTYDLNQLGAELLLSKGFALLTPYIGAGLTYSRGKLGRGPIELTDDATRAVAYAGLRLNLFVPKIVVEVEKGEVVQGAVRVGFGL